MTWAPYSDTEIPRGCTEQLKREILALNAISRQVRVSVDTYYLFKELTRRRATVGAINGSSVEYGARVVAGAVIRDLVISLGSIFDPDTRALDLVRVLNTFLRPENIKIFCDFHVRWPVPYDTDAGV